MENTKNIGLIAHRGYSSIHPHNALEAFEASLKYQPTGIEIDVVLFDHQLYLYHPISHKNAYGEDVDIIIQKELTQLQKQGDLQEYLLSPEILKTLRQTQYLVLDLKQKNQDVLPPFIQAVESFNLKREQIVVGARDEEKLNLLNKHHHLFQILSLSSQPDSFPYFLENGADIIRLWDKDVSSKRIEAIHQIDSQVWVTPGYPTTPARKGTAGQINPERLLELQDLGVDAILVNDIKMARKTLENINRG